MNFLKILLAVLLTYGLTAYSHVADLPPEARLLKSAPADWGAMLAMLFFTAGFAALPMAILSRLKRQGENGREHSRFIASWYGLPILLLPFIDNGLPLAAMLGQMALTQVSARFWLLMQYGTACFSLVILEAGFRGTNSLAVMVRFALVQALIMALVEHYTRPIQAPETEEGPLAWSGAFFWGAAFIVAVGSVQGDAGRHRLHEAARKGDLPGLQAALSGGANVNVRDRWGRTALHYAAGQGRLAAAERLLSSGADINAQDYFKQRPIGLAWTNNHEELKVFLLNRGASVGTRDFEGARSPGCGPERTPLHLAVNLGRVGEVKQLVSDGADVNARDNFCFTPLHVATLTQNHGIVAFLVEHGAEIDARDHNATTPLHNAALMGNFDSAALLLDRGADVNAKDKWGIPPLGHARTKQEWDKSGGRDRLVELLLSRGAR